MITKGLRGATTVSANTPIAIEEATIELLTELQNKNKFELDAISHVIFTFTKDLDAAFPAKFARKNLGWSDVAMICTNEIDVPNSVKMCLRVLIVINCGDNFTPEFVYLNGAKNLRK